MSLIQDLLVRTIESVSRVLEDGEIETPDTVLLVGGSTYIPAVWELVAEETGVQPRQDVAPSEAVALGAGIQGAIIAGEPIDAILVDVSPHALGVAVVNFTYDGEPVPDCYKVLIHRNTTLPVTVEEIFSTMSDDQDTVHIEVYQGDNPVASQNAPLGDFLFEGLQSTEPGDLIEFPVQFSLDLNGILDVKVTDRATGRQTGITVETNHQQLTQQQVSEAISRISTISASLGDSDTVEESQEDLHDEAENLLDRARDLLETTRDSGLAELIQNTEQALDSGDDGELRQYLDVLLDFLFENSN